MAAGAARVILASCTFAEAPKKLFEEETHTLVVNAHGASSSWRKVKRAGSLMNRHTSSKLPSDDLGLSEQGSDRRRIPEPSRIFGISFPRRLGMPEPSPNRSMPSLCGFMQHRRQPVYSRQMQSSIRRAERDIGFDQDRCVAASLAIQSHNRVSVSSLP